MRRQIDHHQCDYGLKRNNPSCTDRGIQQRHQGVDKTTHLPQDVVSIQGVFTPRLLVEITCADGGMKWGIYSGGVEHVWSSAACPGGVKQRINKVPECHCASNSGPTPRYGRTCASKQSTHLNQHGSNGATSAT